MSKTETFEVKVLLLRDEDEVKLRFCFEDVVDLKLESDNLNDVKKVFLSLACKLKEGPVSIVFEKDESINHREDELFIETAKVYTDQLQSELKRLEDDSDLKAVRNLNK